jgi:hypothetical protein
MTAEISFDTVNDEEDRNHIEGCYRLDSGNWRIFYLSHYRHGKRWDGPTDIDNNVTWPSGMSGIQAFIPKSTMVNNDTAKEILSEVFCIDEWAEVRGPDSLQMK